MTIVSKFMTPADKVVSCYPDDNIKYALQQVIDHPDVGAVVVLHPTGKKHVPVGIVTKSDLLQAYAELLDLSNPVETIMGRNIETLVDTQTRDAAAEHFEKTGHHHALVVNSDSQWVGVVAVWDVTAEVVKDCRAWPWNRDAVEVLERRYSPHHHRAKSTPVKPAVEQEAARVVPPNEPDSPVFEEHSFLDIAGVNE